MRRSRAASAAVHPPDGEADGTMAMDISDPTPAEVAVAMAAMRRPATVTAGAT